MTKQYLKAVLFLLVVFFGFCASTISQSGIIETIYFKPNSFSIDKKYKLTLNNIAKKLSSGTFVHMKIFAFTDTTGTENYNDALSEKRADAVYNYLVSKSKFDTTRVYVTWLGESADIYDLHFPEAHEQQRCVDIWVQFYKKPSKPK